MYDVDGVGDLAPEYVRYLGRVCVCAFLVLAYKLFFRGLDALYEPQRILAGGVELL